MARLPLRHRGLRICPIKCKTLNRVAFDIWSRLLIFFIEELWPSRIQWRPKEGFFSLRVYCRLEPGRTYKFAIRCIFLIRL
jgi:hypothetical protein